MSTLIAAITLKMPVRKNTCEGGALNKSSKLTPAQKHVFARKFANLSSLMGLGGSMRASQVEADELNYSSHFILNVGDALEVAISCSFSKFRSGESEFNV